MTYKPEIASTRKAEPPPFYVSEFTIRSGNVRVYEASPEAVTIESLGDETVIDIRIDDIEAVVAALIELKRNLLNKG